MATIVSGNSIAMTRGDTLRLQVGIEMDGAPYTPEEGDSIAFYLKHNVMNGAKTAYKDAKPLITKQIPIETMILTLVPEETKEFGFGKYVYDLEITFANGTVDTFINNAELKIMPEVG